MSGIVLPDGTTKGETDIETLQAQNQQMQQALMNMRFELEQFFLTAMILVQRLGEEEFISSEEFTDMASSDYQLTLNKDTERDGIQFTLSLREDETETEEEEIDESDSTEDTTEEVSEE